MRSIISMDMLSVAIATVASIIWTSLAHGSLSAAHASNAGYRAAATQEYTRFIVSATRAREVVLAAKPSGENVGPPRKNAVSRANAPVVAVIAPGAGQAGYVHYFLLKLPDDTFELQIGIEMDDGRMAWSFPDLGVIVSPFIDAGSIVAGGKEYELWHLYGIRPFPDEPSMAALRNALPVRIRNLTERAIPYCENDGPQSPCMSCLGFVMRVLFPGRDHGYPEVPRDFAARVSASRYTTHDLLLYMTGLLHLPTREARLQRLARLAVPEVLREDLAALVRVSTPPERAKRRIVRDTAHDAPGVGSTGAGVKTPPRNKL